MNEYIITKETFNYAIKVVNEDDLAYFYNVEKSDIDKFAKTTKIKIKTIINESDYTLYFKRYAEGNLDGLIDRAQISPALNINAEILHFVFENVPFYRRAFLNKYLKNTFNRVDTFDETSDYSDLTQVNTKYAYKLAIISMPRSLKVSSIKRFFSNGPLKNAIKVYDKSDEWDDKSDLKYMAHSDMIFCSSKYIYDTIPEEYKDKKYLLENGGQNLEYPSTVNKFNIKTAVYIGAYLTKVDRESIFKIAEANPDWNIYLITKDKSFDSEEEPPKNIIFIEFINDLKILYYILCRCHLGLCLLTENNYTKGMLSDKLFNYINAHLTTLINEFQKENYANYTEAVSVLDKSNLDLDSYIKDCDWDKLSAENSWNSRFDKMMEIIKEKYPKLTLEKKA